MIEEYLPAQGVEAALAASWLHCHAIARDEWMYALARGYVAARLVPVLIQTTCGGGVHFGAATTRALAATAVPLLAGLLSHLSSKRNGRCHWTP